MMNWKGFGRKWPWANLRYYPSILSQVSSVSIVSDYRLDDRGSIPGRGKGFFL
jgi:hypothetical protein